MRDRAFLAQWIMLQMRSLGALGLQRIWELTTHQIKTSKDGTYPDISFGVVQSYARSEEFVFTKRLLDRLVAGGYIKSSGDFRKLSFTSRGILQLVTWCLRAQNHSRIPGAQLCIVSFDIPEKYKRSRDEFRRFLVNSGFIKVHKSMWVNDNDVGLHIKYAAHLFGLGKYVSVFRGKPV